MNQSRTRSRQIGYSVSIDTQCGRFILLGTVYVGISGTVNDEVNSMLMHECRHGLAVGNIQFRYVRKEVGVPGMLRTQHAHLIA